MQFGPRGTCRHCAYCKYVQPLVIIEVGKRMIMDEPKQTAEEFASNNNNPIDSDDEEEEYECRVCRGPAEEG